VNEQLKYSVLSSEHAKLFFVSWKLIQDFRVQIWGSYRRPIQFSYDRRAGGRPQTARFLETFPNKPMLRFSFTTKEN